MTIQKHVVSRDPAIYEAWPDVVQTNGGKLICIFSECVHHRDRTDARIALCESTDRGCTWSEKRFLTEKGRKDRYYNCARISGLRDGRLAIICDHITGDETRQSELHLWLGDGEGKDWGDPIVLPFCGIVPDKLTELKNGRWLVGAHFRNRETQKLEQYLWYSDNQGQTWSNRITVAADPRYNLCEVSFYECDDGTLVAFMRENSFMGYDCMKALSYDHGETWTGVYHCPIPGCHRPVVGRLRSGRLLLTYRFAQGGRGSQNVAAALFSEADAKKTERTEQTVRIMPLDYDRNPTPDLGYTGWTQFDDGEIYVVNYIMDDADRAQIRGYSFCESDFIL